MPLHRGDLNDAQWQKLYPLLPKKARTGRPAGDHRAIINGILWIHRTGAPWDDLPECYGSRGTVSSRFDRWRSRYLAGDIKSLTANRRCRESNRLGSTFYRQHHRPRSPTRRRSKKGELNVGEQSFSVEQFQQQEALRRSRGGFSTKIHIQAEGMGKPMHFVLTEGQRSDVKGFSTLNMALKVKRTGRGKPKQRPRYLVGDKGACRSNDSPYFTPSAYHAHHPQAQEC